MMNRPTTKDFSALIVADALSNFMNRVGRAAELAAHGLAAHSEDEKQFCLYSILCLLDPITASDWHVKSGDMGWPD